MMTFDRAADNFEHTVRRRLEEGIRATARVMQPESDNVHLISWYKRQCPSMFLVQKTMSIYFPGTKDNRLEEGIRATARVMHFTEMCSGSEAGSYLRLIDSCITQLKAQGPSRTCNKRSGFALNPAHPGPFEPESNLNF